MLYRCSVPCKSPVNTLDIIMALVGETKSIGKKEMNGMTRVQKDQPMAAFPSTTSPPYLSLSHPPTTCVAM